MLQYIINNSKLFFFLIWPFSQIRSQLLLVVVVFQGEITFNARDERAQHQMGLFQYKNEGIEKEKNEL